jgi:hypothetical protein
MEWYVHEKRGGKDIYQWVMQKPVGAVKGVERATMKPVKNNNTNDKSTEVSTR